MLVGDSPVLGKCQPTRTSSSWWWYFFIDKNLSRYFFLSPVESHINMVRIVVFFSFLRPRMVINLL